MPWQQKTSKADTDAFLRLALQRTSASTTEFITSLSSTQACSLACSLGLIEGGLSPPSKLAATTRLARTKLKNAAAWAHQYRKLQRVHSEDCADGFGGELPDGATRATGPALLTAFSASAHIMQEEAGSAVLTGPDTLLTCAHCVSAVGDPEEEDPEEEEEEEDACLKPPPPNRLGRVKLILLSTGTVLVAECAGVDEGRDLAVLRVIARSSTEGPLPWMPTRPTPPPDRTPVMCVGNPSDFDLEVGGGRKIKFQPPIFHSSKGLYRGATDAGRRKELGLGGMRHTCWTYWGHSGAPIFDAQGALCGLHNSWDPDNGHRHGVAWEDIAAFLGAMEKAMPEIREEAPTRKGHTEEETTTKSTSGTGLKKPRTSSLA